MMRSCQWLCLSLGVFVMAFGMMGCGESSSKDENANDMNGSDEQSGVTTRPLEGVMAVYEVRFRDGHDPSQAIEETVAAIRLKIESNKLPWIVEKAAWNQVSIVAPADYEDPLSVTAAIKSVADFLEPGIISFRMVGEPQAKTDKDGISDEEADRLLGKFPKLPEEDAKRWQWYRVMDPAQTLNADNFEEVFKDAKAFEKSAADYFKALGVIGSARDGHVYILLNQRPDQVLVENQGWKLSNASKTFDPNSGFPALSITLDAAGAQRMKSLSSKNIGKQMAVLIDQNVVLVATIHSMMAANLMVTSSDGLTMDRLLRRLSDSHKTLPTEIVTPAVAVHAFKDPRPSDQK